NVPSVGLHAPARPFGGRACRRREPGTMAVGADRRGREWADPARDWRSELPRGAGHRCGTFRRAVPRPALPHILIVANEASPLAIQPRRHEAAAPVVAEVGAIVLERPIPDGDVDGRGHLNVVLLLRQIPLDVEDDLAALREVER